MCESNMSQSEDKDSNSVNLDVILVKEVGQFGWFQLKILLLSAVITVFNAIGLNEFTFTTAAIETRCKIPGCDDVEPVYSPSWILNAVPGTSQSSIEECVRYQNTTILSLQNHTCPASYFQNETTECDYGYVYSHGKTVVKGFDLGCQEWKRAAIGTYGTFGSVVGHFLTGFFSDRYGRKAALVINAVNGAWLGTARYWTNSYAGFIISQFIQAAFSTGSFACAYILVTEFAGPKYRIFIGCTMNVLFAFGQIILALIAKAVPEWRLMTLVLYVPQLITISYIWLMPESVRWLLSKRYYTKSTTVLKEIAETNNRCITDETINALIKSTEEDLSSREGIKNEEDNAWLPILVFKHKKILLRCMITPFWWFTNMFVAYGLNLNSVNLSGNLYVNYILVQLMSLPSNYITAFLMTKYGRKIILRAGFLGCVACQFAYILVPLDKQSVSLLMYLMSKFFSAMVMCVTFIYTAELYPTQHRHKLFSFSYLIGRIGTVVAPLTTALSTTTWYYLPSVLFIGFAFVASLLTFLTPETQGVKLPDTMQEAADLDTNKTVIK